MCVYTGRFDAAAASLNSELAWFQLLLLLVLSVLRLPLVMVIMLAVQQAA